MSAPASPVPPVLRHHSGGEQLKRQTMHVYQYLVTLSHCRSPCPSPPVQLVLSLVFLLHLGDDTTGRHELLIRFIGLQLSITCQLRVNGVQGRSGSSKESGLSTCWTIV